jgi:hypothetical protein
MHQKNGTTIWGKPKLILIENWGLAASSAMVFPEDQQCFADLSSQIARGRNARLQKYDLKTQTPWNGDCTPKH